MSNNVVQIIIQAVDKGVKSVLSGVQSGLERTNKASQAYHQTLQTLNGTADHFRTTMAGVIATLGGAQLFATAGRGAVQFNSTLEQSRIGVSALVRAFADADGKSMTMAASMQIATDIQKKLQIEGLRTTATYQELLKALQEGLGPALKAGFNPDQVVKFTSLMTQAAAALSVPMDQLGQEIRSILEGTIDSNSRVAKALGISNEKVKELAANGTLFDYLSNKLRAFGDAGDAMSKTLTGAWSNLIDAMQMALGTSFAQSFSSTTAFLLRIKDAIVTVDEAAGTFTFNERIVAALQKVDKAISEVLNRFSGDELAGMLASFVEMMGTIAVAVIEFAAKLSQLWQSLGPFAPTIAALVVKLTLLSTSLKLLIGLPIELYRQIVSLQAGFTAFAGPTAVVLGAITKLTAAFAVGWEVGTWLNQFDVVKQAGVAMAAGLTKAFLRVKEAWAWITGGDVAAIQQELAEAERIYSEMFAEIDGKAKQSAAVRVQEEKKVTDAAKTSASGIVKATGDALKEMQKKYQEYAAEVRRLQDEISGRGRSLASELRALSRTGMTDVQAWDDQKREAKEYETAAKQAATAAKAAFAQGDTITAGAQWKTALEYADQAKQAYAGLNTEVKSGEKVVVTQQEALKTAMDGVKASGELAVSILKQQQEAANGAMNALTEKSGFANLAKGMDEAEQKWLDNWQNMRDKALRELVVVEERIQKIVDKDRTVYINVKTVEERSTGGLIRGYHLGGAIQALARGRAAVQALATGGGVRNILAGGHLPGFGGGDTVPLWGEAGEYMINKWASLKAGLPALQHLNAGNIGAAIAELTKRLQTSFGYRLGGMVQSVATAGPQRLATGGGVAGGGDIGTLTLTFPSGASIPVQTSKQLARQMLREFEQMGFRASA